MSAVVTIPERPAPSAPRAYRFPAFEQRTLSNGMRLVVAPVHKLPVATILLVVDAGAVTEAAGQEGVANLTARALLEGTAHRSGIELAERFELLGATVESGADWDSTTLGMNVLSDRLPQAFELFAEVLREPGFPEREIARLRAERLAEILQLRAEPRGLADEMFDALLYDAGSRYAQPEHGSEKSVEALTVDRVQAFHALRYQPGAMTLIVAGDVGVDAAMRLAEDALGDWTRGSPPSVRTDDRPRSTKRQVHIVRKVDAPQSELRIGHVGLPRAHPDYFPALVMNSVLGGLFSSRINLNLREVHAYTYGAFSAFDWRRGAGPFVVSSAVKSDVTVAATREVLTEIERMRESEITPDELSLATSYLDGVFPIRYETASAIARALGGMIVYGLPQAYFDTYRQNIRAVSLADVHRVAREHLQPDRLQIVVVGDPNVVRKPLEDAALGDVAIHEG